MKLLAIMRPRDGVDVRTGVARHAEAELQPCGRSIAMGSYARCTPPEGQARC
jgi:hypothetical protein